MIQKELHVWLHNNHHKDRVAAKQHNAVILQQLLRGYSDCEEEFEIRRSPNGKPLTPNGPHFSYSHSEQLHAFVIADHPIGIDVEKINPKRIYKDVAERYFHPLEWQRLQALPAGQQQIEFFRLWSAKEAWCKLEGGKLWQYLGQELPSNIYFMWQHWLKGFTCVLASEHRYDDVRLNVLA